MTSKRELQIVSEIIRNPKVKSGDLQKKLSLSKRQIDYSINKINEELHESNLSLIQRNKNGTFNLDQKSLQYFVSREKYDKDIVYKSNGTYSYHNQNERIPLLVLYILTSTEILSLVHIYDYLNVSRNTAISDLKKVTSLLSSYNLRLEYTRSDGYQINGSELQIRILINDLVKRVLHFPNGLNEIDQLAQISIEPIIHFVHKVEKKLKIVYSDNAFNFLVRDLQLIISRNFSRSYEINPYFLGDVSDTKEYEIIKDNIYPKWLKQSDDLSWITLIFLSSNILRGMSQDTNEQLKTAVSQMVDIFQDLTYVKISDRKSFEARLFAHIRPAYFRMKYDLSLGSIGIEQVVSDDQEHRELLATMKKVIDPLESLVGSQISLDELELISFYFGFEFSNRKNSIFNKKKRAAVVCSNGQIVSKLMLNTLCELFPEINFISSSSVREFENFQQDYDLVFTTIPLKTEIKQYVINPIMDNEEKLTLRSNVLCDIGIHKIDTTLGNLLTAVKQHAVITNEKDLRNKMRKYLLESSDNGDVESTSKLPDLSHYLKQSNVKLTSKSINWKQAIILSSQSLVDDGTISENYVSQMIAQNDTPIGYSFLGKSMAIPHASFDDGVHADGFGLLISKESIAFPGNHFVHFIVPIAVFDETKHLKAINQLSRIAENPTLLQRLLYMNDSNSIIKTIYSEIKGKE
ncbi:BglG family transcription antiterminator [Xylocopilactobacillus apis]|uniref:Ascorbate-specific PTS system EIIA component n=1 Tax=Xylocopilactobacillus apis TaxID=2932183 RepID=A0AAU9D153_9LACO|nr:BglG family transcription antiterminator [Xylocopilactobacillus apis]BDR57429.1 PTS sugar transporter subunit IIA [Xylocopilactobacillus apis]